MVSNKHHLSNFISPGTDQVTCQSSMQAAWATQTQFSPKRYPSLIGRQRQHGMRILPNELAHDQQWKLKPRHFDLEWNAMLYPLIHVSTILFHIHVNLHNNSTVAHYMMIALIAGRPSRPCGLFMLTWYISNYLLTSSSKIIWNYPLLSIKYDLHSTKCQLRVVRDKKYMSKKGKQINKQTMEQIDRH